MKETEINVETIKIETMEDLAFYIHDIRLELEDMQKRMYEKLGIEKAECLEE